VTGMPILDRKLLRDLWRMRGQLLAVALVLASGVSLFITMRSMHGYLRERQAAYYDRYAFADVFASLRRAPQAMEARLAALPGVARLETRVVADVILDVPGLDEPASGRLISVPDEGEPALNRLHLRAGDYPAGERGGVLVSAAFAAANRLQVGDRLGAILNGRWETLHITGLAQSPEFIYEIQSGGIFPDNRRFGVLWMRRKELAAAFDLTGAFNDVSFALAPGASEPELLAAIDRVLLRYGAFGAYGREDQISHNFIEGEIEETQVTSIIIPAICLGVTAFLLHLVLSRLVALEREQIGVLKAFGYRHRTVAAHYLKLALAPVVAGSLLGTPLGLWFATGLAAVYARFFQFPDVSYQADWPVVGLALALAGGASVTGAIGAVRRSLRLPPAEAMRPESPPVYRPGVLERLGFSIRIPLAARTIARDLERRPIRSMLAMLGLALAMSLCLMSQYMFVAVDQIKTIVFDLMQREDVAVTFQQPEAERVRYELARFPGVLALETFRGVPVRLRRGHRSYRTAIQGVGGDAELRRVVNSRGEPVTVPPGGLLLAAPLAARLDARPGDLVTVEVLEGRRRVRTLMVAAVVEELIGMAGYASPEEIARLTGEKTVSGAFLQVSADRRPELFGRLKRLPAVAGVGLRETAREGFERTIAESFAISITSIVLFAVIIAFGVVYNSGQIALQERGRELASLRVLGFTRGETTLMLLGEQAALTLLAIPLGMLIGYGFILLIVTRFESEIFRLPMVLAPSAVGFGMIVLLAAAAISAVVVGRRVHRLDLIAVLKTRE